MDDFDVVIVGSGSAGQTAAYVLNAAGLRVAVIEKSDRPGGTCALAGCQAKKWLYEAAETVARSRQLSGRGIVDAASASWSQVIREKNAFTSGVPGRTVAGFRDAGIEFIEGNAHFTSSETVDAGGREIGARFFMVAAGARPMTLPLPGSDHLTTSSAFMELETLPERIVFVGGGFIAFEFAHFAARLGPSNIRIVILEAGERPLGPFDAEMVALLVEASREINIEVVTGVRIEGIEKIAEGSSVTTADGRSYEADIVAHGAGRVPDIEGLGLETGGIAFNRRGIVVNDRMLTSNPRVYAAGDCVDSIQLARVADFEGHTAATNILAEISGEKQTTVRYSAVPAVLFTVPQYGMVGKTEAALQSERIAYRKSAGSHLNWPTYRRIGLNHAAYKIMVAEDGTFLGAHFISDNASGLVNTIRLAMENGIAVKELYRQGIMSPYPSRESDLIYMLKPLLVG
jgi:glutathione reductase (NADPH)